MNFKPTPAQETIRRTVREFAETRVAPVAAQLDEQNQFPAELVAQMGRLGIMGLPFSPEYGGAGGDTVSYAIAVEELSRADAGVGVILSAHVSLGSWPIAAFGTEQQKRSYLAGLAAGSRLGAFGLTEANAGSDAGKTETTAVRAGDYYLLNGSKIFITNAGPADTYIVFAVTTPGVGTKGISAFIVEKGWEGFSFGVHYNKMGIRSSATAELVFRDVKVPAANLLGQENQGFKIAMQTLEGGRIGIAAQALGIAQGAYEKALDYARQRVQFGQPIAAQQSVAFKLADMATKIRAARLLIYSAAALKDAHEPYGTESAMAKMYASDICLEVVNDAVQIYGGYGYIKGFDVERMYRDAKITTIYEGTNEIQRLIISQAILGRLAKDPAAAAVKPAKATGPSRKGIVLDSGSPAERVARFVQHLRDEHAFGGGDSPLDGNLTAAAKVIGIGRGLAAKQDLPLIEELAAGLGAALGCSRPFAEELQWLPLERFIGISGQKLKGSFYLAIGLSGAVQHLAGIRDARVVAAINSDAKAPIFAHADYGIVGDLYEIVPLLRQALK